ncbi:protein phosphatase 1 regulatory subunit 3C-like [Rhincodon typus]|uniref:protein phosphatase 1 regulatory subunit 3C-like n=1 Tax=Rhincodon typus TaxID=259920 RepID=UPI00202DEB9C|nr:protein phosphatase 1 regulatory subunit 3C-like [Rhincodon typus]
MPVDITTRLCLGHSPPPLGSVPSLCAEGLRGVRVRCLGPSPLRPCLNGRTSVRGCGPDTAGSSKEEKKKKVVFADARGFSLTAVRLFSELEDELSDLQFELSDLAAPRPTEGESLGLEPGLGLGPCLGLRPDFTQPSADLAAFRRRLQRDSVCLESSTVQGSHILGTVRVRNLAYEKRVVVRVTFDAWRTFHDVTCSYVQPEETAAMGGGEDAFSFKVELPKRTKPLASVELCVSFQCDSVTFWDNNQGQNYRFSSPGRIAGDDTATQEDCPSPYYTRGKTQEGDLEQFGSPRSVNAIFSQWQSWGWLDADCYW